LDSSTRSLATDISQLNSDVSALKRLTSQLSTKIASARNQSYPTRNDVRVLQQKVYNLENTVGRLEARK
jgi:hypothetical protein